MDLLLSGYRRYFMCARSLSFRVVSFSFLIGATTNGFAQRGPGGGGASTSLSGTL